MLESVVDVCVPCGVQRSAEVAESVTQKAQNVPSGSGAQAHPGRVAAQVQANVAAEQQQRLQAYCQAAGVSIA